MGLDQYAYSISKGEDPREDHDDRINLMDWRKHNRLQGYMEELAIDKGVIKPDETFNCEPVQLTEKDIDDLEQVIIDKKLPETGGFFFGGDSYETEKGTYADTKKKYVWTYDKDMMPDDLKFIEKAREALARGEDVYYDSWW